MHHSEEVMMVNENRQEHEFEYLGFEFPEAVSRVIGSHAGFANDGDRRRFEGRLLCLMNEEVKRALEDQRALFSGLIELAGRFPN
jgi:hypothetical protein